MRRFAILAASILMPALAGCATVVSGGGRDPKVTINSDPLGATVSVDGNNVGVTPAVVEMSRRTNHSIIVTSPTGETAGVEVKRHFNPWVVGNLFVGGPLGLIVDVATDSTHRLTPNEINVNLKKTPPTGVGTTPPVPTVTSPR